MRHHYFLLLTATIVYSSAFSQTNTFPSSGNVGIGTLTPQQRLHVEGTSNQAIFVSTSPADAFSGSGMIGYLKALPTASGQRLGYLLFGSRGGAQNAYNPVGVAGFAGGAWTAGSSYPTYLIFETTPSGSVTRLERMRIDQNGNVGIGTKSPKYRFHVEGANTQGIFVTTSALGASAGSGVTGAVKQLPTAAGQRLGFFLVGSRGGADNQFNSAGMTGFAEGAWSGSSRPTYLALETTTAGSTTRTERMRIAANGNVGIGVTAPANKLEVDGGSNTAIYGTSSGTYGVIGNCTGTGIYGSGGSYGVEGYAPGGQGFGYGVYGHSSYTGVTGSGGSYGVSGYSTSSSSGYGVYGHATNNATGIGVYGEGYYGVKAISSTLYAVDGTGWYVGVIGRGSNSNPSSYGTEGYGNIQGAGGYFVGGVVGVQGYANAGSGTNYGVYGGAASGWAGYFNGPVFATSFNPSDNKLKKNVEDVKTALDLINQLHPKVYEFRHDGNYQYMRMPQGKHYGLVAQELEQVLPGLVKETQFDTRIELEAEAKAKANGDPSVRTDVPKGEVIDFKAVNYTELIPILVKGTQEMDKRVQIVEAENSALKQEIAELRQMVLDLKRNGEPTGNTSNYLAQCTPNPAKSSTRISYSLPEGNNSALLQITDNLGRTVRMIQLTNSGATNVDVSSLSAGVYNYSLVVDNKTIQTKKMTVMR